MVPAVLQSLNECKLLLSLSLLANAVKNRKDIKQAFFQQKSIKAVAGFCGENNGVQILLWLGTVEIWEHNVISLMQISLSLSLFLSLCLCLSIKS
jgi:hypothetical protein